MAATRREEVSGRWAVCLPREAAAALGPLRRLPGVTVRVMPAELWLQGSGPDEALERSLRALPGARRFVVLADGQLLEAGKRVPHGFLPGGTWRPLAEWLEVQLEAAGLAGRLAEGVRLRLVRSAAVREANVLLTSLRAWGDYGGGAAQVRLERWSFAVSDGRRTPPPGPLPEAERGRKKETAGLLPLSASGRGPGGGVIDARGVVVRGEPLPPLPGQRFVEAEGVALPAGWEWEPAVEAAVLRELLGLRGNDLALLHPDGSWDHVRGENFVRASRSAIRLSAGGGDV